MKHKRWLLLAACAALVWGAVRLLYFFYPPPPPLWPHEVVAEWPSPTDHGLSPWFAAQLTGEGGLEVVAANNIKRSDRLEVWEYRDGFQPLAEANIVRLFASPYAVGDLDGDGRDEIFFIDPENRLLTVRLRDGALHVDHAQRLTDRWIEDVALARLRPGEPPEVVLLAASTVRVQAGERLGGGRGDVISGHRWDGAGWEETWRQELDFRSTTLLTGHILPGPGDELALEVLFSGLPATAYKIFAWDGRRLSAAGQLTTEPTDPHGRATWHGLWPDPRRRSNLILATTYYGLEQPPTSRLELLDYDGNRLRKRYRLPDPAYHDPLALPGDFRGNGKTGILISTGEGRYTLLEPR